MSRNKLTRHGYIIEKQNLTDAQMQKIRKDLTMTPQALPAFQSLGVKPKSFKTFVETTNSFYLPRYYGLDEFGEPAEDIIDNGKQINLQITYDLLAHQIDAWKALQSHFDAGKSGIFSLFCGGGKTSLAIRLACHLSKKTLVVVNKEVLMDQWRDRILQFTGGKASVGRIQQNIIDYEGHDFVLVMLHSLSQKTYNPEIFKDFGLTIVDECHHIAAGVFSQALPKIASRYMLGLSATPDRKDGLSVVFYRYMGPLFYCQRRSGTDLVLVKSIHIKSLSNHYRLEYLSNGTKNTSAMVSNIANFETRNLLIIEILGILVAQGRKILLLSGRRDQLERLAKLLEERGFLNSFGEPATFGLYYGLQGGSKKKHRNMLENSADAQIILGTTNIAQEGLDIPELNTLFLISSLNDVEQASGRILRKHHEKLNPLIIDLVDQCGNFPKHFKNREKYYLDEDYVVSKKNIEIVGDGVPMSELRSWIIQGPVKSDRPTNGKPVLGPVKFLSEKNIRSEKSESQEEIIEIMPVETTPQSIIKSNKKHTDKGRRLPVTMSDLSVFDKSKNKKQVTKVVTLTDNIEECLLDDE